MLKFVTFKLDSEILEDQIYILDETVEFNIMVASNTLNSQSSLLESDFKSWTIILGDYDIRNFNREAILKFDGIFVVKKLDNL